jgi:hypothetical protein
MPRQSDSIKNDWEKMYLQRNIMINLRKLLMPKGISKEGFMVDASFVDVPKQQRRQSHFQGMISPH